MNRKSRILSTVFVAAAASGLAGGATQAKTVVTMNTVQIFGTIDPAKISDYTDYMAAVNLYDGLVNVDPAGKYVISTRVRCGRSLQGYPFNPCLTEAQYKEMETKVKAQLETFSGELKGTYYPLTGMDKATQTQLINDHFLFKEGDRFLQAANACRYWPTGRGIFLNTTKTFLMWVNEEGKFFELIFSKDNPGI